MPRVDNVIDVRAPREKVFEYVSDIERQAEWVKWAKKVATTSAQKQGLGATDTMLMQVGPNKQEVEGVVTEYKEGQVIGRRLTRGLDYFERVALVSAGDLTKVAWSIDYTPPLGPMGKVLNVLFMQRLFDQLMKDSLNNLREHLEQKR